MNIVVFNLSLVAAWLLLSIGAGIYSLAAGFAVAGTVLLGLTLLLARVAGVYATPKKPAPSSTPTQGVDVAAVAATGNVVSMVPGEGGNSTAVITSADARDAA